MAARGTNPGIKIPGFGESSVAVRTAMQEIVTKLGTRSSPTFASLCLSSLTVSRLLASDASKQLVSTDLNSWVAGTANEVTIADDGDGTITIGIADPLIVGKGGSGVATLTDHGILLGSGTDAITPLGAATDGQLPIGSTGADPVLAALTGTANQIAVTNGAGTITLSLAGNMDEIAALTPTDSNFIVGNGTTWVAESGNDARTSLGLGTGDNPEFTSLNLTTTSGNPLYAGPWTDAPSPIESHTNIYQSLYCGNVGGAIGRTRLGSNSTGGFIQWNRYYTGSMSAQMDASSPSFGFNFTGSTDLLSFQRSPAGSTTMAALLDIYGATGSLVNSGGGQFTGILAATDVVAANAVASESLANPNLTSGTNWSATGDCTLANNRAEFVYGAGTASALTQASGTMAIAGKASRWYKFTYTVSSVLLRPTVTITTSFAEVAVTLRIANGTHSIYFKSAASPGDFVISTTLESGARVYLDTFSLKEVTGTLDIGGRIRTNDKFNVAGVDGVTQAASAGVVSDVTALAGGITTAQTAVTPIVNGVYSLVGITSITTVNGRITALT